MALISEYRQKFGFEVLLHTRSAILIYKAGFSTVFVVRVCLRVCVHVWIPACTIVFFLCPYEHIVVACVIPDETCTLLSEGGIEVIL